MFLGRVCSCWDHISVSISVSIGRLLSSCLVVIDCVIYMEYGVLCYIVVQGEDVFSWGDFACLLGMCFVFCVFCLG